MAINNAGATPGILTNGDFWSSKLLRMQRKLVHAAMQANVEYNTPVVYTPSPGSIITLEAGTIHSVTFSVITGTLTVSFDAGSTSHPYPAGSNVRLEATTTFGADIILTLSGGGSDEAIISTMTA